jgi:hypothetical protein
MNKLVVTALLGLAIVSVSCKKCQECTTDTKQIVGGFEQTTTTKDEYCGDEYDNAPTPGTYNQTSGGVEQEVKITCTDN